MQFDSQLRLFVVVLCTLLVELHHLEIKFLKFLLVNGPAFRFWLVCLPQMLL